MVRVWMVRVWFVRVVWVVWVVRVVVMRSMRVMRVVRVVRVVMVPDMDVAAHTPVGVQPGADQCRVRGGIKVRG